MDIIEEIKSQIADNPVLLYMKGVPEAPQCGFSAHTVQALKACDAEFESVNILERQDIRQALPGIANWPTFPQLYIKGELIGGCDIVVEMHQNGELKSLLDAAKS